MSQRVRACILLSLSVLAACGTTRRFVGEPPLTVEDSEKDAQDARQAAATLFNLAPPYTVTLCEADPASKECKPGNVGITATGVGGLLLPLTLHVTALTISKQSQVGDSLTIDASFRSKVDSITPMCRTAHGQIISRQNNTISVELENFYCNWAVVGNVLVNADLSIDDINLKDKVFTGFYKVTFHGTGNAAGSGYYKAVIAPLQTPSIG
jgi:hypothetical protein